MSYATAVSVPSRGARYLNVTVTNVSEFTTLVSVPSRGARYLNLLKKLLQSSMTMFPSPLGEQGI